MAKRKPRNYWDDFENVRKEVLGVAKRMGHFPTSAEMREEGFSILPTVVIREFGSIHAIKAKLNCATSKDKKPNGYWQDVNNGVIEAKRIMEKHSIDTLPSQGKLKELGYSSLDTAIYNYYGGFFAFRRFLGEKEGRVPHGSWQDEEFLFEQIRQAMEREQWNVLPGYYVLNRRGYHSLVAALSKIHGGIRTVRSRLGQPNLRSEEGKLKDFSYVVSLTDKIKKKYKLKNFPSEMWLRTHGYTGLVSAIYRYHSGMTKFKDHMGESSKERAKGIWKHLDFALEYASDLMRDNGWQELPSQRVLYDLRNYSLIAAIGRYHGGFPAFRAKLNEFIGRVSQHDQLESLLETYAGGNSNK